MPLLAEPPEISNPVSIKDGPVRFELQPAVDLEQQEIIRKICDLGLVVSIGGKGRIAAILKPSNRRDHPTAEGIGILYCTQEEINDTRQALADANLIVLN